jgi:hypothetical protein
MVGNELHVSWVVAVEVRMKKARRLAAMRGLDV